jgi:large subunit ribosomal protein L1
MNLQEALTELRKNEKRKFDQSIDLIVNLKGVDLKRDNVAAVFTLPNPLKAKNICAFLEKKNELVKTVIPAEFVAYKDKKTLKKLVKQYDAFIGVAKLMPQVATVFGKALGPAGKMPSPQLGIILQETDNAIKAELTKVSKSIKLKAKEPSIKLCIAKESMSDKEISENIDAAYNAIVNALPTKKENLRSVMVKLSMSKPLKVEMK